MFLPNYNFAQAMSDMYAALHLPSCPPALVLPSEPL